MCLRFERNIKGARRGLLAPCSQRSCRQGKEQISRRRSRSNVAPSDVHHRPPGKPDVVSGKHRLPQDPTHKGSAARGVAPRFVPTFRGARRKAPRDGERNVDEHSSLIGYSLFS
jgi:hypothetical protein